MFVRGLTRIDEGGFYWSPNICFAGPDDEDTASGEKHEDVEDALDDEDEGADLADGEEDDDGDAGDEGREDDERDAEARRAEEPDLRVKKRSASDVIRDNKRAAKEATRKADEAMRRAEVAERRAEAAERSANERRQAETAAERAARRELMSDGERYAADLEEVKQSHAAELNGVKFQVWDATDSSKFERLCDRHQVYDRIRDKVEDRYADLARQGKATSREVIAKFMLGEMMVANAGRAKTKQTRRADEGIRRETTKPTRARSTVAPDRQRRGQEDTAEARRRRLEGVTL